MKVLLAVVLTVASVAARGSGPYLPSGWKPQGPAFYLPSEVGSKPADSPLKETFFQESEASGSDSLREYGPPKLQEVANVIVNQGLPDAVSDQVFQVIQTTSEQKVEPEAIAEQISEVSDVQELAPTEVAVVDEVNTATEAVAIEEKTEVIEIISAVEEEKVEEVAVQPRVVEEQAVVIESISVEEKTEEVATAQPIVEEKIEVVATETVVAEDSGEAVEPEQAVIEQKLEAAVAEPVDVEQKAQVVQIEAEVELTTQISTNSEEISQINIELETSEGVTELAQEAPIALEEPTEAAVNVESEVATEQVSSAVQQVVEEIQTDEQKVEQLRTVVEEVRTVEEDVKSVKGEVNNIADALVVLENEAKAEQVMSLNLTCSALASFSETLTKLLLQIRSDSKIIIK